MDLSPSLLPHPTAIAGSQSLRASGPSDEATPLSTQTATTNVAFYFRNWPFPVDAAEQVTSDVGHRSWQEKLVSYREASRALIAEKARAESNETGQVDAPTDPEAAPQPTTEPDTEHSAQHAAVEPHAAPADAPKASEENADTGL